MQYTAICMEKKLRGGAVSKYILNLANTEVSLQRLRWTQRGPSIWLGIEGSWCQAWWPESWDPRGRRRESSELNMNRDLGKGDVLPSHLLKKYVPSKKHEELLPQENNWPGFYSCQAFLETRQNELRNSRSPHVWSSVLLEVYPVARRSL